MRMLQAAVQALELALELYLAITASTLAKAWRNSATPATALLQVRRAGP
jgi:hypothetical protein